MDTAHSEREAIITRRISPLRIAPPPVEWAGGPWEIFRFELSEGTEPAGTEPAAMQEESHYDFEMVIEHHVTAENLEEHAFSQCICSKKHGPPPPPVDVGMDAEEICRCRNGFGHAEAELHGLPQLPAKRKRPSSLQSSSGCRRSEDMKG